MAFIDETVRTSYGTSYRFIGDTAEELNAIAETEKGAYHPAGYGTWFRAPVQREDGKWVLTGSRSNSCD